MIEETIGTVRMINADCMDVLKSLPDKSFELAIVDPPYGIDINSSGRICKEQGRAYKGWDQPPPKSYFDELKRVAENYIIWGANHFISRIPVDAKCWIVWDKEQPESLSFAMCELALTSFTDRTAKIFRYCARKQSADEVRIHPTQKPVKLYQWLLLNYAKPGDRILDTHNGSGSINIACDDMGFDLTAIELDPDYYQAAKKRLIDFKRQLKLF